VGWADAREDDGVELESLAGVCGQEDDGVVGCVVGVVGVVGVVVDTVGWGDAEFVVVVKVGEEVEELGQVAGLGEGGLALLCEADELDDGVEPGGALGGGEEVGVDDAGVYGQVVDELIGARGGGLVVEVVEGLACAGEACVVGALGGEPVEVGWEGGLFCCCF